MAKIYKDLNTVTYDVTACAGALSMSYSSASAPQAQMSDDGTITGYVTKGGVSGTFAFTDAIEAADMADKTAASKNLTFKAHDEADADVTVTVTNIKTGSVQGGFSQGVSTFSVAFVADSVSSPA